ncbi:unnamed protein product [Caenorhabditis auriculariae]|uniref:Transposase Tc1-like domain-containing protein n=1 Tax=Caenorhabditis auriculariae TaxID=2777116 RepID=A0A8S1HU58_9PELO|nr:unnamed protein product [Caenorhabditis auriculariae]
MMGNEEAESDAEQERELPDSQEEYSEGEEVVDLDENAGQERREILVAERAESRRNLSDRYVYLLQREVSNFMTSTQVDDMFEDAAVIAERSQVWPITMALLDLPASKRFLTRNLLTAGLYRGQHKPSLPEWNELSGHVLDEIRQFPVFAVNGEAQYEVHFKIALAVLDFEALRSAYRIRLYESGVCNWCDIQGIRLNGAPRYSYIRRTSGKKNLTDNDKRAIVVGRQNGLTMMTLAGMFGVTEACISQFLKRWKAQDGTIKSQRTERPRVIDRNGDRNILKTPRTNPRLTAPAIRREVFLNSPSPPSVSIVKRRLNAAGIRGRRPVKKPLISE